MSPLGAAVSDAVLPARSGCARWLPVLLGAAVALASLSAEGRGAASQGGERARGAAPRTSARAFERLARAALLRAIPFPAERVRVSALRIPRVRLPRGPLSVNAELRAGERFRGATTFALVVEAGEAEPQRVWATAEVRVKVRALVAARDLARGRVVSDDDVTFVTRDLSEAAAEGLSAPDEVVGQVVKRSIRAFAPLRPGDLEKRRVVERGALVTLRVAVGGLVATVRARTLDAGAKGDLVRAVNLSSGRTVHGRVKGAQDLLAEF